MTLSTAYADVTSVTTVRESAGMFRVSQFTSRT